MLKKILSFLSAGALALSMAAALPQTGLSADNEITASAAEIGQTDITLNVKYHQTEARSMLKAINDFRTGDNAWAWNSDNSQKIRYNGLGKLTIDPTLEKVAMQRAADLIAYYSHTRPDGYSCFSAYPDSFGFSGRGENIAFTSYCSTSYVKADTDKIFNAWLEEDDDYSGQGHRRNMLGNYQSVGIACVEYENAVYWVQEFSTLAAGSSLGTANDSSTPVTITIDNEMIGVDDTFLSEPSITVGEKETISLPSASRRIKLQDQYGCLPDILLPLTAKWSITSGSDIVSVSGNKMTGIKKGSAVLTATAGTKTVNLNVTVEHYHNYLKKVIAPTYARDGYTRYTCTDCGYSYTDDVTPKLDRTSIYFTSITVPSVMTYTGKAIKPAVKITYDGKTLRKGTDYTVTYKNNKKVGIATVTITGKGAYQSFITKSFKIRPKPTAVTSLTSPKTKRMKVKYNKVAGVTGYKVKYSLNKSFSSSKTVTVKGANSTSKTIKSLKKGKTYYVKVRAYKTVNGTNYYSTYSKVKKVKVK